MKLLDILDEERLGKLPRPTPHDLALFLQHNRKIREVLIDMYHNGYTYNEMIQKYGFTTMGGKFMPMSHENARRAMQYFFNGFEGNSEMPRYSGMIHHTSKRSNLDNQIIAALVSSEKKVIFGLSEKAKQKIKEGNIKGGKQSRVSRGAINWEEEITSPVYGTISRIELAYLLSLDPLFRTKAGIKMNSRAIIPHLKLGSKRDITKSVQSLSQALRRYEINFDFVSSKDYSKYREDRIRLVA